MIKHGWFVDHAAGGFGLLSTITVVLASVTILRCEIVMQFLRTTKPTENHTPRGKLVHVTSSSYMFTHKLKCGSARRSQGSTSSAICMSFGFPLSFIFSSTNLRSLLRESSLGKYGTVVLHAATDRTCRRCYLLPWSTMIWQWSIMAPSWQSR